MSISTMFSPRHFRNKAYICPAMENNIDFNTYLSTKKIDSSRFRESEPELYEKLDHVFSQIHPNSFTAQKLFLINPLRRKYLLANDEVEVTTKPKVKFKPKFK